MTRINFDNASSSFSLTPIIHFFFLIFSKNRNLILSAMRYILERSFSMKYSFSLFHASLIKVTRRALSIWVFFAISNFDRRRSYAGRILNNAPSSPDFDAADLSSTDFATLDDMMRTTFEFPNKVLPDLLNTISSVSFRLDVISFNFSATSSCILMRKSNKIPWVLINSSHSSLDNIQCISIFFISFFSIIFERRDVLIYNSTTWWRFQHIVNHAERRISEGGIMYNEMWPFENVGTRYGRVMILPNKNASTVLTSFKDYQVWPEKKKRS